MNKQEIYNKVRKHLLTQGTKSIIESVGMLQCRYKGPGDTMCAIGCLIPNKLYDPKFEGLVVNFEVIHKPFYKYFADMIYKTTGAENSYDYKFLSKLQDIHDLHDPIEWAMRLDAFAERYDLEV